MYLISVSTLEVEEFLPDQVPEYAILSHTWESGEITYQDITSSDNAWRSKNGWAKIRSCALQAKRDGIKHIWVDSCCIDKKSSAELQEAINSMFRWYRDAKVCYAYLSDVPDPSLDEALKKSSAFQCARWFRRGWTLQELLAPDEVVFFSRQWEVIGNMTELSRSLEQVTGIGANYILGYEDIASASVAERMSWMRNRSTTRVEDMAYCMLGIFDIAMPMLYGEGTRAFRRLQEEIIKVNNDPSIFIWGYRTEPAYVSASTQFLADSPVDFWQAPQVGPVNTYLFGNQYNHFMMTQSGLQITLNIVRDHSYGDSGLVYGLLNCQAVDGPTLVGMPMLLADSHPPITNFTSPVYDAMPLFIGWTPWMTFTSSTAPENMAFRENQELMTICLQRNIDPALFSKAYNMFKAS